MLGGVAGASFATSLQLGCVRLTERFLASDPPTADELEGCAAYVQGSLPALEPMAAIGVSGTVTTIAALDLDLAEYESERVHGHRISRAAVERLLEPARAAHRGGARARSGRSSRAAHR